MKTDTADREAIDRIDARLDEIVKHIETTTTRLFERAEANAREIAVIKAGACPMPGSCKTLADMLASVHTDHGQTKERINRVELWRAEFKGTLIGAAAAWSFIFTIIGSLIVWFITKHRP